MYCGGTFALSVITFNALDFGSRGLGSSPGRVTALSYNSNSAALHLGDGYQQTLRETSPGVGPAIPNFDSENADFYPYLK